MEWCFCRKDSSNEEFECEMFDAFPLFQLRGVAKFLNGSNAEKDIDLRIVVLDQNDCAPVFTTRTSGAVREMSARGTGNIHPNACYRNV